VDGAMPERRASTHGVDLRDCAMTPAALEHPLTIDDEQIVLPPEEE
jgi:hypothetical protein